MKERRILKGTYIGDDVTMAGQTALVMEKPLRMTRSAPFYEVDEKSVLVQTDDRSTGYGYGWHPFLATDWEVKEIT